MRRAVGATRTAIISQVVVAADVVMGAVAAALAVATAVLALRLWIPNQIPPETAISPPGVPWTAIAWGTAAAAVTTVVGSAIPAAVAGRVDVAGALRD